MQPINYSFMCQWICRTWGWGQRSFALKLPGSPSLCFLLCFWRITETYFHQNVTHRASLAHKRPISIQMTALCLLYQNPLKHSEEVKEVSGLRYVVVHMPLKWTLKRRNVCFIFICWAHDICKASSKKWATKSKIRLSDLKKISFKFIQHRASARYRFLKMD